MISTIIIIILTVLNLGIYLAKHGQDRCDEKYNFFTYSAAVVIVYFLYYHAGLFDKFF